MKIKFWQSKSFGFTLIEILIYAAIVGVSAVFVVGILTSITRSQLRQASVNEVNQQLSFVASTIQKLVRDSSLVENDAGTASTTLVLRMSSSSLDKTFIYASGTAIYLEQGSSTIGGVTPVPLTNDKVNVSNYSVTKYENPGGLAVVQVDLTLDYNTATPQAQVTQSWRSAISRVTAATFDSDILPNSNNTRDIGNAINGWRDAYFARRIGIGAAPVSGFNLKTTGDIGFSTSSAGVVFMAPDGNCFRLTVNSSYKLATSSVSCP